MKVKEITIKHSYTDEFHLYCIGDIHGGTVHHVNSELLKTIKKVKDDPLAKWIDMGDKIEAITPSDKRWDGGGIADWVSPDNIGVDQSNWYCDQITSIKDKCIGMLEGNHEDSIKRQSHIDVHGNICKALNLDDLSYSCFIKFTFHRNRSTTIHTLTGFFTHGAGGAITPGSKLQRLARLMDGFDADIVAQGHVHDLLTYVKPYMTLNRENRVKQRVCAGALTGCYFGTYTQDEASSYGERKNYPPTMIGSPVFIYNPETGNLRAENG